MYQAVDNIPGIEVPNITFPLLKKLSLEEQHIGENIVSMSFPFWR